MRLACRWAVASRAALLIPICSIIAVPLSAPADHISILPLGQIHQALLTKLDRGLSVTFSVPLDLLRPVELPSHAYDALRGQYNSTAILDYLIRKFRGKPLAKTPSRPGRLLAVSEADLYADGLNYVFGEADMANRVSVVSLARLRNDPDGLLSNEAKFVMRAIRESVHELGHTYGLVHCSDPTCVMYFSNNLEESDRRSCNFCPDCRRKLGDKGSRVLEF